MREQNKRLTTGQMIDTLKMGEIAECVSDGFYEGSQLKRTDYNEIVFTPSGDLFKLTTFAYNAKWKIIPKRKKLNQRPKAIEPTESPSEAAADQERSLIP